MYFACVQQSYDLRFYCILVPAHRGTRRAQTHRVSLETSQPKATCAGRLEPSSVAALQDVRVFGWFGTGVHELGASGSPEGQPLLETRWESAVQLE